MKTFIALMLLLTFSSKAIAQDNAIRQKIEAAGRDPKTAERAAKADALLFSKKRMTRDTATKAALFSEAKTCRQSKNKKSKK